MVMARWHVVSSGCWPRPATAVGIVRNPDHVGDVQADGAEALLCDLETTDIDAVAAHLERADAVVFAAGAAVSPASRPSTATPRC
jgi:hypothetical protein